MGHAAGPAQWLDSPLGEASQKIQPQLSEVTNATRPKGLYRRELGGGQTGQPGSATLVSNTACGQAVIQLAEGLGP